MLAAEAAFGALHEGSNMNTYWDSLRGSWVWKELYAARNYRPVRNYHKYISAHMFFLSNWTFLVDKILLSHITAGIWVWANPWLGRKCYGTVRSCMILFFISGFLYDHLLFVMSELFMFHYCSYVLKGKVPFTLKHGKADHEATDVSVHKHLMTCLVRQKKKQNWSWDIIFYCSLLGNASQLSIQSQMVFCHLTCQRLYTGLCKIFIMWNVFLLWYILRSGCFLKWWWQQE